MNINKEELLKYELPAITEYVSIKWIQTLIARFTAYRVNKKIFRYRMRIKREEFLSLLNKNYPSNE